MLNEHRMPLPLMVASSKPKPATRCFACALKAGRVNAAGEVTDEDTDTPCMASDDWFVSERCDDCGKIVEK